MIELIDTLPDINVQPAEYKRLLGYPREHVLRDRSRELADWARTWYAKNGKPWVYAREVDGLRIDNDVINIDSISFTSKRLQKALADAGAHAVVLVAVGAGPEVENEAQRLWKEEKPDEYFFLEIYGSAIVEHLVTTIGARLCGWAESHELAVLPHYSPGYPEWDIAQQPKLMELIRRTRDHALPGQMEVMESGMLRPKKSLLAVFGLTRHLDRVRKLTDLVPCENCSYGSCQYRRVPYVRAAERATAEVSEPQTTEVADEVEPIPSISTDAKYITSIKALRRWADERLTLTTNADGTIDAVFKYEGTTCSNTGRALYFDYAVKLGARSEGYPILEQTCVPTPGDEGYKFMCRYMNNAEHLMVAIEREKPLIGQRLDDVLTWQRPSTGAGCYCEPGSRKHKWGLVLETIHYALVQHEKQSSTDAAQKASVR